MKLASLLHRSVSISILHSLVVLADSNITNGPEFENIPDLPEELRLSSDFESLGTSKITGSYSRTALENRHLTLISPEI